MGQLMVKVANQWVPAGLNAGPNAANALGIVAVGSTTNNLLSLATAPGVPVTTAITFTPMLDRRYIIKFQTRAISSPGATSCHFDLYIDGGLIALGDSYYEGETAYGARLFEWLITGNGVPHTYQVYGVGPATVQIHNQMGGFNAYFYIEDVGPVSSPPLPIATPPPSWIRPLFLNGWEDYGYPGWERAAYRKIGDVVTLRGLVKRAAGDLNQQPMFVVPPEYCAPAPLIFTVNTSGSGGIGRFDVQNTGAVYVNDGIHTGYAAFTSLSGVSWSVTP